MPEPSDAIVRRLRMARLASAVVALILLVVVAIMKLVHYNGFYVKLMTTIAALGLFFYLVFLWWGRNRVYILSNESDKGRRSSGILMWVGVLLLPVSLLWVFVAPSLFDLDTNFGAFMDLGVALIILFVSLCLISTRRKALWTIFLPRGPDDKGRE